MSALVLWIVVIRGERGNYNLEREQ
jgi:hypothetical protein